MMQRKQLFRPYLLVFLLDMVLVAVVFGSALLYHQRFFVISSLFNTTFLLKIGIHTFLALTAWVVFGIYKRMIRFYRALDFIHLIGIVFLQHVTSCCMYLFFLPKTVDTIPLFAESYFVTTVVLMVLRYAISFFYEKLMAFSTEMPIKRILIYGAGHMGTILKKSIETSVDKNYEVVAFIDDDPNKIGRYLLGTNIYSAETAIEKLIAREKVTDIIIATLKIPAKQKRAFLEKILPYQLKIKQVDSLQNWYDTDFKLSKLANINLNDLMGREPILIENEYVQAQLANKVVLVTGAAGSIGSELVRTLVAQHAETIVCVDFSESALYDLQQELIKKQNTSFCYFELCDIRDKQYLTHLFYKYKPNIVYHSAAYKHVPLMEEFPWQSIHTNVMGTWQVAQLAMELEVEKFVLVSTDKAVNPQSVMGITKRLAEIVVRSLASSSFYTKFIITRFGNVLGSNGSVVPLFKKQIMGGGPVTVTHPNMERYFMTIPEASRLVVEASVMGKGGEIFVFDMGNPVKIVDLATNMIRLAGYVPDVDIKIVFTGMRKGEKLSEEIFSNREQFLPTYHNKIFISSEGDFDASTAEKIIYQLARPTEFNSQNAKLLLRKVLQEAEMQPSLNLVAV